jgi:hypothetical protein
MAWPNNPRPAKSITQLRRQMNIAFPDRDTSSDGLLGDPSHKSRHSDHNAWVKDGRTGVVTAIDIDKDLNTPGATMRSVVDAICSSKDPRVKYIIFNGKITVKDSDLQKWKKYTGPNPHDKHAHISVSTAKNLYDDTSEWSIGQVPQTESQQDPPSPAPVVIPTPVSTAGANATVTPAPTPFASSATPTAEKSEEALPSAATGGDNPNGGDSSRFDAFIPQINTAKSWLAKVFAGTSIGAVLAMIFNLPVWLQIGLFSLLVIIIVGAIIMFIKYHAQIFEYVTKMNTIRATDGSGDPVVAGRPPGD